MKPFFYDVRDVSSYNYIKKMKREILNQYKYDEEDFKDLYHKEVDKETFLFLGDITSMKNEGIYNDNDFYSTHIRTNYYGINLGFILEFEKGDCFISVYDIEFKEKEDYVLIRLDKIAFHSENINKAKLMMDIKLKEKGYKFEFKGGV